MSPPNFRKKEIKEEEIGEILKKEREKKGKTLFDIEESTKIRVKYLSALEEGDYENLPPDAYTLGFLKKYCQFLKINEKPIIELYKKERGAETLKKKLLPQKKEIKYPKIYITPSVLAISLFILIVFGIFSYIGYQVFGFAKAPYLLINSPNSGSIVTENPTIVSGKTQEGASLFINGQNVFIDPEGNFKQEVKLQEGSNEIKIVAQNKANKKTEKELTVIYQSSKIEE